MTTTVAPETRIDRRFRALKQAGRSAFVTFLTAGDPDPATSAEIIAGLPAAGADVIEIGRSSIRVRVEVWINSKHDGEPIKVMVERFRKNNDQS